MLEPRLKSGRRILVCRIVFVASVGVLFAAAALLDQEEPPAYAFWLMPLYVPALPAFIFMFFNLMVFPFRFSVLGSFERTPLPQERPLMADCAAFGHIGLWGVGYGATWYVYSCGLGIEILGAGTVFIPRELIVEVRRGLLNRLVHRSPEVRKFILVPKRVAEAVAHIIGEAAGDSES